MKCRVITSLLTVLLTIAPISARLIAADKLPNVVLIISDDQTWTDYGFMGHDVIKTPNLDRLAKQSVTFKRGYVPTALCRPSLATMITGLYARQHKVSGNDPALLTGGKRGPAYQALRNQLISHIDRLPTLPKLLKSKGYVSHQSGKWWEGNHQRGGFTHGMTHGDPKRGGRHGDEGLKIGRTGLQPIFNFIDEAGDKPFFLWYAPFLPHTPHRPPARLLRKYQTDDRPLALAKYYAMCDWFDETCGALLDRLDEKKLSDNTLVIYVTDNGWIQRTPKTKVPPGWRSSFAPKSKQSPYDGGVRTPIMVRWPQRLKPKMMSTLVSSVDIAPTVLAAAGMQPTKSMSGINLLKVAGGEQVKRDSLFGESFAHDIADINEPDKSLLYRWCIEGRWKLILTYDGKLGRYKAMHLRSERGPQLFDLQQDPHETKNLAEANSQIVERLKKKIDAWAAATPAPF